MWQHALLFLLALAGTVRRFALADDYYGSWIIDYATVDLYQPANQTLRGSLVKPENQRQAYLINNQYPGPLIKVQQFDRIVVNITNRLGPEVGGVSITWQGIQQIGTQYSDGVPNITQCAIGTNQTYLYNFTATQHGTYWYHAYLPSLYGFGLVGAIVIDDPTAFNSDLYPIDNEIVMLTADQYRRPQDFPVVSQQGLLNTNGQILENQPYTNYSQMLPVNTTGYDRYPIDLGLLNGWWGNGTAEYPYPTINVTTNTCYRMRNIIATSLIPGIRWFISGHNLTIISHTSVDVEKNAFSMYTLQISERIDGVLCTNATEADYKIYYMTTQAITRINNQTGTPECVDPNDRNCWTAVLRVTNNFNNQTYPGYVGNVSQLVNIPPPQDVLLKTIDFVEHIAALVMIPGGDSPTSFPQYTNQNLTLYVGAQLTGRRYFLWTDRNPFVPPTTPLLLSNQTCGLDSNTHVVNVPIGWIVDMVINNLVDTQYPVHMHGARFWVPGAGYKQGVNNTACYGTPAQQQTEQTQLINQQNIQAFSGCPFNWVTDYPSLNLTFPPYPDTVVVAPRRWVFIRLRLDSPGAWVFESSRQYGDGEGMRFVFMVGQNTNWPKPPRNTPGCGCVSTQQVQALSGQDANSQAQTSAPRSFAIISSKVGDTIGLSITLICFLILIN